MLKRTFEFKQRVIEGYDVFNDKTETYIGYAVTRDEARALARAQGGRKAGVVIEQVAVLRREVR